MEKKISRYIGKSEGPVTLSTSGVVIDQLLNRFFEVGPDVPYWTATSDILDVLEIEGLVGNRRGNSMALSKIMETRGCRKRRNVNTEGLYVWGYEGAKYIGDTTDSS